MHERMCERVDERCEKVCNSVYRVGVGVCERVDGSMYDWMY